MAIFQYNKLTFDFGLINSPPVTWSKYSVVKLIFLVAKSNSIRGFVRPSVRGSVGPSVRPWVGHAFLENLEFKKIQVNSTKFTPFRNCWPCDGLVFEK